MTDLNDILSADIDWWRVLLALLVGVAAWIISRFARKGTHALMLKAPGVAASMAMLVSRFTGYAVLLLGWGLAFALLGANVQPLLAIVIILAVVAVLVLRGVADNFAAGVLLQARQTVRFGDEIVVEAMDGHLAGTVQELNARAVLLLTVDGRTIHVPNAKLLSEPVINDSSHGVRRSEVEIRVRTSANQLDEVVTTVVDAARSVEGVQHGESARTLLLSTSEDRCTIRLQFWHHPLHASAVTSDVVLAVSQALLRTSRPATVTSRIGAPPLVPPESF